MRELSLGQDALHCRRDTVVEDSLNREKPSVPVPAVRARPVPCEEPLSCHFLIFASVTAFLFAIS